MDNKRGCYYCYHREEWNCKAWKSNIRESFSVKFKKLTELINFKKKGFNVGYGCSKFLPSDGREKVLFT